MAFLLGTYLVHLIPSKFLTHVSVHSWTSLHRSFHSSIWIYLFHETFHAGTSLHTRLHCESNRDPNLTWGTDTILQCICHHLPKSALQIHGLLTYTSLLNSTPHSDLSKCLFLPSFHLTTTLQRTLRWSMNKFRSHELYHEETLRCKCSHSRISHTPSHFSYHLSILPHRLNQIGITKPLIRLSFSNQANSQRPLRNK